MIQVQFTYLGHSCFLLKSAAHSILFDPFIRGNELASKINPAEIHADFILVSHGHSDHINDCVEIASRTRALVITNWEIHEWLQKQGITNTHPMNVGGNRDFPFGNLKVTYAAHSSSLPDGTYGGNPMGFILEMNHRKIYYAGDTALTLEMQLIGQFDRPDIAILPIGNNFTMDYVDAVRASEFIHCHKIIGVHFDTFGFIKINHQEVNSYFESHGKTIRLPKIGETFEI